MGRPNKPRYRRYGPGRGAWVTKVDGSLRTLASGPKEETRAEARRAFHSLMAAEKKALVAGLSLESLGEAFLDMAEREKRPLTVEFYARHVRAFWGHAGAMAAGDVRPLHVTAWLDAAGWGPTTRHGAIAAVKRMFRWGLKQGHLAANPLADMEKPTPRAREEIMSAAQVERVLAAVKDEAFRDLLAFVRLTGCRPSEAMAAEARHVDFANAQVVMESKTTGATRRPRRIYLTPEAVALCRRLASRHPEGPLLRNVDGGPWNRHATKSRFARLRAKLGLGPEATLESFRHEFATDGLVAGLSNKEVAELMGHTSTAMVDRHYSKLHRKEEHLGRAAERVRPGPTSASDSASRPADPTGTSP